MLRALMLKGGFEQETLAYAATHTMTDAEKLALDLEIKAIKRGEPLTLSSVTCNLSLATGAYFITNSSVDLTRYSGIAGVQYSVAATGTPATTAVFGGTITAGSGETLDGTNIVTKGDFSSDVGWTLNGWSIGGGVASAAALSVANLVRSATTTTGALYKSAVTSVHTAGTWYQRLGSVASSIYSDGGSKTAYITAQSTTDTPILRALSGLTATFDNFSQVKVLTPDALGLTASTLVNGGIAADSASYVITVSKP